VGGVEEGELVGSLWRGGGGQLWKGRWSAVEGRRSAAEGEMLTSGVE
jgi:hypothetical protein